MVRSLPNWETNSFELESWHRFHRLLSTASLHTLDSRFSDAGSQKLRLHGSFLRQNRQI